MNYGRNTEFFLKSIKMIKTGSYSGLIKYENAQLLSYLYFSDGVMGV
jgi:hypothetical protein